MADGGQLSLAEEADQPLIRGGLPSHLRVEDLPPGQDGSATQMASWVSRAGDGGQTTMLIIVGLTGTRRSRGYPNLTLKQGSGVVGLGHPAQARTVERLRVGLNERSPHDRAIYVALTRARETARLVWSRERGSDEDLGRG